MEDLLDQTTLSTLSLMESRLKRIEHLLYGQATSASRTHDTPAARRIRDLERALASLLSEYRVYSDILKIHQKQPDLFHEPAPGEPPSQLDFDSLRAVVLASASSFPATVSALTAIKDCPIPDPSESASLIGLTDRMKAIEATQISQAAEVADLRRRSEVVMRTWYENGVLGNSRALADVESRAERVEREVRRHEKRIAAEDEI